jgi:hypothetical protein
MKGATMSLTAKMERFLPDVTQVLRRFPVAVLAAVMLCGYLLYTSSRYFFDGQAFPNALIAVFLAGGIGHLFAEGRKLGFVANALLAVTLAAVSAALVYFSSTFHTSMLFFFGGIALLLMVSPFLRNGVKQGAVWLFNLRLALAVGLAIIVGVVFGLGLSAVVAGLKFLLNINFGHDAYERIWVVATTLVGPLYGLSLVPKDLKEEIDLSAHHGSLLERGVSILVNYVMVPLALVYALILHAYAAKIAFLQSLPKGEIGLIVSLFAVGGTVTWLIGWPWREKGTALLHWFMRGWFWLLPVPAVLLAIAIWRRVTDYGVTPDRYGIALVAVWTAFVFAYLVWRRNRADMRAIVGSAAVLLLVGSFGPQGAFSTTAVSQVARLQVVLEKIGALKNGKIVGDRISASQDEKYHAITIVTALADVNGLEAIRPWFEKPPELNLDEDKRAWQLSNDVSVALGLQKESIYSNQNYYFTAIVPNDHAWSGKTRTIGPLLLREEGINAGPKSPVDFKIDGSDFAITLDGKTTRMKITAMSDVINAESKKPVATQTTLELKIDDFNSMFVGKANGITGDITRIYTMEFWIVQHE